MSVEAQRVVVIQDASRNVSLSAIRWVLEHFSLKPGDVLILFGVLHQVNNPMGYKIKVDSRSMFGVNPKFIAEEVAKKKEEYSNNAEIMNISDQCKDEQIEFQIEVRAGSIPKEVALKAARILKATWVILDRQMKKDKKFFMAKLSCGISRMKRDNTIEQLRGPKTIVNSNIPTSTARSTKSKSRVRYDEMIPGSREGTFPHKPKTPPKSSSSKGKHVDHGEETTNQDHGNSAAFFKSSDQLSIATASTSSTGYHEASSYSSTEAKSFSLSFQEEANTTYTQGERTREQSPLPIVECQQSSQNEAHDTGSPNQQQKQQKNNDDWMGEDGTDEIFRNSVCSVCYNRRPKIGWTREFTYAELHAATDGFSLKNFLSEGGFGSVYRGDLNGLKIAVKQHKSASFQGEKEFKSEVHVLSKARYENLVMLLGSCSQGNHRLLVYEYVCNGSLDQHLSKHTRRPLSWANRMKIAMGAAKGLQYLHENNIIHRDMRPSNILITHDHESLLGDFGLARTQHEDSDHSLETRVVGTLGYLAPEYAECGRVSTKTDVYSFGVVLLQLITGLKTTDKILGGRSLVGWARPLLKERNYPDLIDDRILDSHDVHQLFWMVRVAERCLSKDPQKRLTMDKVVYCLDYIMQNNTTRSIQSLSPVQSDSASSTQDSPESQCDDDTSFTTDTTSIGSISFTTDTTSISRISQISGRIPLSLPFRLPPSPPIQANSSTVSRASTPYTLSFSSSGTYK